MSLTLVFEMVEININCVKNHMINANPTRNSVVAEARNIFILILICYDGVSFHITLNGYFIDLFCNEF
jgi:hypothetical protein